MRFLDLLQLLVDAGADTSVTTKRGFTPLEIARGQNNVVSSKPGVAAVLESAQIVPRVPWAMSASQATPQLASRAEFRAQAVSISAEGVRHADTDPEAFGSGSSASRIADHRNAHLQSQAWSPLPCVQAATAASADAALDESDRVDMVRAERAAMERTVANALREAQHNAAKAHEREEAQRRARAASAAKEDGQQQFERERRSLFVRLGIFLCIGLAMSNADPALASLILSVSFIVLLLPSEWLASAQQWRAAVLGTEEQTWPAQFLCPITGELMEDPVTTADGHTFERLAIERWLQAHDTSPMTGARLIHTQLAPAIALRQLIANSKSRIRR